MRDVTIIRAPDALMQPVDKVKNATRPYGLVLSSTSHKREDFNLIDPRMARLKRMKKAVLTTARLHQETIKKGFRLKPAMLTLTYKPSLDCQPKHISHLIGHVREWFRRHTDLALCGYSNFRKTAILTTTSCSGLRMVASWFNPCRMG